MMWAIAYLSLLLITSSVAARGLSGVDCSQFQQTVNPSGVTISFTSILDNDVGPNGYLRVKMVYEGQAWLGFGISARGWMTPGFSVIGVPAMANGPTNPGKYEMPGYFVNLLNNTRQTLQDASIVQNSTHTVLTFTKRMQENGEYQIHGNGTNTFLLAVGGDNTLSFHAIKNSYQVALRSCVNGAPIVSAPSPSLTPSYAPFDTSIPYTSSPTAAATTLAPGVSHSPSIGYSSSPSLALFDSSRSSSSNPKTLSPSTRSSVPSIPTSKAPSNGPTTQPDVPSRPPTPPTTSKPTVTPTSSPHGTKPTVTPTSSPRETKPSTITPTSSPRETKPSTITPTSSPHGTSSAIPSFHNMEFASRGLMLVFAALAWLCL